MVIKKKKTSSDFELLSRKHYFGGLGLFCFETTVRQHVEQKRPFIQVMRCKRLNDTIVYDFGKGKQLVQIPIRESVGFGSAVKRALADFKEKQGKD